MKILCSIYLVRHPLGGHAWHHLQYLVGLRRLGHEVVAVEHFGWASSCYDPRRDCMSADPSFGLERLVVALKAWGLENCFCYLSEDGSVHGLSRAALEQFCRECDLHLNLSNMNDVPECKLCRRSALVDTDPVFTQIGAHGMSNPADFDVRFTYGENVHQLGCSMPTGGLSWLPTRQPVVMDAWKAAPGDADAPFTSVMNWTAYGTHTFEGHEFGQKDREFEPYFDLPRCSETSMELAISAPASVIARLREGGWRIADPLKIAATPDRYQEYLRGSLAEWCVAKHGYVETQCGWFSDRSAGYLASGRPVVLQDTGFSRHLPCGEGLLTFRNPGEALQAMRSLQQNYPQHCIAARQIAESYFDSTKVLKSLLERCF